MKVQDCNLKKPKLLAHEESVWSWNQMEAMPENEKTKGIRVRNKEVRSVDFGQLLDRKANS